MRIALLADKSMDLPVFDKAVDDLPAAQTRLEKHRSGLSIFEES